MRFFIIWAAISLLSVGFSATALADGNGPIADIHYSIFDADQNTTICFEIGTVWYGFVSNGSAKQNAVTALLIGNFSRGAHVSVNSNPTAMSPNPCQAWDITGPIYQANAISFSP